MFGRPVVNPCESSLRGLGLGDSPCQNRQHVRGARPLAIYRKWFAYQGRELVCPAYHIQLGS